MEEANQGQEAVVTGTEAEAEIKEMSTNKMKTTNLPLQGTEEGNGRPGIYLWNEDPYTLEKTETQSCYS